MSKLVWSEHYPTSAAAQPLLRFPARETLLRAPAGGARLARSARLTRLARLAGAAGIAERGEPSGPTASTGRTWLARSARLTRLAGAAGISGIAGLVAAALTRTLRFQPPAPPPPGGPDFETGAVAPEALERLGAAIRLPTVSRLNYDETDFAPFDAFKKLLTTSFPLFHQRCELEVISGYALVYRWPGSAGRTGDSGAGLEPIALMAHYDVVPVEAGSEAGWRYPPFSGAVADGMVWGRGALDDKSQLMAQLEAAENLMRAGFVPRRDIYFCYGHDEETGGRWGAARIVEHLAERGVRFAGVLDEGGIVVTGALPGVSAPVAVIGVAEKGQCAYQFTVNGPGGHASTPPQHTALGLAAQLITMIEQHPLPPRLIPPVEAMLRRLAGQMGFATRLALANLWLLRPLTLRKLTASPATNALVRTTFAATMASAADAPNALPLTARFSVNVRLLPGDTPASVRRHFEALIARAGIDARIEPLIEAEPSPVSPTDSDFFRSVESLARELYPSALVTPYLVVAGTDSRRFHALSENVLRFTPFHLADADQQRIHGTDECLSTANYGRMMTFYERLLRRQ
ncbi:MAG: M20/M25/M40 family metallo-hydrolase [Bifidobacteriaceae bacterium]|jgi:carboxypeptidase PM20D1|nr:M20/M25/M40 family metallo-hydrolase [Bifidobacteriaceae bacterium]